MTKEEAIRLKILIEDFEKAAVDYKLAEIAYSRASAEYIDFIDKLKNKS